MTDKQCKWIFKWMNCVICRKLDQKDSDFRIFVFCKDIFIWRNYNYMVAFEKEKTEIQNITKNIKKITWLHHIFKLCSGTAYIWYFISNLNFNFVQQFFLKFYSDIFQFMNNKNKIRLLKSILLHIPFILFKFLFHVIFHDLIEDKV